ncbi:MAG: penicillin-binding protein 1C [Bacteroidetes bacterium]|nr:penicillin-binding protein 1C [Bacteroidota bacterium]
MNKTIKKVFVALGVLLIICFFIPFSSPFFETDYSQIVKDKNGKVLRIFLNNNEQWCLPPEDTIKIPDKLKESIICFEDNYFKWHIGINPVSIVRATYQNISEKHIVSGASTITMQLARIRKHRKRTFFNKIIEMFEALKIEFYYSKNKILMLYLNHAPFGGNIKGYRAASYRYFDKPAQKLSWAEASTLAVLPNAPGLVSPSKNQKKLKEKRNSLLKKLFKKNKINKKTLELALLEPIPLKVHRFKIIAPHLTQKIHSNNKSKKIVKTTIDADIQEYTEILCKQHIAFLQRQGIRNGAALVIETQTGKVRAYVGSQDYFDFDSQGQVDGVNAPRSSGSILKPFLYALSIDEGIIIPQTLIKDVPTYFDAFSPHNADKKFIGIVSAKEALVHSLNVPAVRLLNTYGVYRFYSFLKYAGITTLFRPADDYGLPLIIGGAEVTMWDMVKLFRGLAKNGKINNSYYLKKDSTINKNNSLQLISPGACYLTLEMLKELKRPGAEYYWQQYHNQKPIAWKTGTSYGHKDAWAVGVTPQWTIAVWTGNFTGEGNVNNAGAKSAGPLLFDILNSLPHNNRIKWFTKNEIDFKTIKVCKETGFLAGPYCDNTEMVYVPENMKPLKLCPYHKNIFVDKDEEYTVCSWCWEKGFHEKHYLNYPVDVLYQLKKRGQTIENIPTHNPKCNKKQSSKPLSFIYPRNNARIWIPRDFNGKHQKLIARVAHKMSEKTVFWYIDDIYLGSTSDKHVKAIDINKGWHNLLVTDEDGYKDKIRFYVNVSNKK